MKLIVQFVSVLSIAIFHLLINGIAPEAAGLSGNNNFTNFKITPHAANIFFAVEQEDSTQFLPITFSSIATDGSICAGGSYSLENGVTISGGMAPYTYSWSPSAGLSDTTILSPLASPTTTTAYVLTIQDARGYIITDTINVQQRTSLNKPVINLIRGTVNVSGTFYDTLVCIAADTNLLYQWNNTGLFTTSNRIVINSSGGYGTYTVTIRTNIPGGSACEATSDGFDYHVIKAHAGRDTTICAGQSIVLGGHPFYTGTYLPSPHVSWSGYVTGEIDDAFSPHPVVAPSVTTSYIMTVFDELAYTNLNLPDTIHVTVVQEASNPVVTTSGATIFCEGDSVLLTSTPAASYLWSNGDTTQYTVAKSNGTYTIHTLTTGGCIGTSSPVTIIVNPLPETPMVTVYGSTSVCEGNRLILFSSTDITYRWNTGDTTQNIAATVSGNYNLYTANAYGCHSEPSSPVTVTVYPLPATPVITSSGPTSFCLGQRVTLTSSPGLAYIWNGFSSANVPAITVEYSDSYFVQVRNEEGCLSQPSETITIEAAAPPAVPVISQSGNTLHSSAATGNQWYLNGVLIPGATTAEYTYSNGGNYTVAVSNHLGCAAISLPVQTVNTQARTMRNGQWFSYQCSPNPVQASTAIQFTLAAPAITTVQVKNVYGQTIYTPVNNQPLNPGTYRYPAGNHLINMRKGIYYIVYNIGGERFTQQVVVL